MYARVSRYQMKSGSFEEAQRMVEAIRPQIKAIPGMRDWLNVGRADDGKGVVIALYDSKEAADAALSSAVKIWAQFSEHLVNQPEVEGYDVVMDMPSD